jgi:hypothetical protein
MAKKGKFLSRERRKAFFKLCAWSVLVVAGYVLIDNALFLARTVRVNGQVTGWSLVSDNIASSGHRSSSYRLNIVYKTLAGDARSGTHNTGSGFNAVPSVGMPIEVYYDPGDATRYHCGSRIPPIVIPIAFMLAAGIYLRLGSAPKK